MSAGTLGRVGALALLAAVGCHRAQPLLICNNANCAAPIDFGRDDTYEALLTSLELEWEGHSTFDGIELDSVWDPRAGVETCVFAFSHERSLGAYPLARAAARIAEYITESTAAGARHRFVLSLQGRKHLPPDGGLHTPEQMVAHARCMLASAELVEGAATAAGRPLTVVFGEEPEMLLAMIDQTGDRWWTGKHLGEPLERRIVVRIADDIPAKLLPHVDTATIDWTQFSDASLGAVRDLQESGIDVQIWARQVTIEAMHAIDYIEPRYVITNDVEVVRQWIGPTSED